MRRRIFFEKFPGVSAAAAAQIHRHGHGKRGQVGKAPIRQLCVTAVHAAKHQLSKKALRLSGLIEEFSEKRHFGFLLSFLYHSASAFFSRRSMSSRVSRHSLGCSFPALNMNETSSPEPTGRMLFSKDSGKAKWVPCS